MILFIRFVFGPLFYIALMANPLGSRPLKKVSFLSNHPTETAYWISYPDNNHHNYGVFHFRKKYFFKAIPKKCIIHVSGDERYILYVNGTKVASGPGRSDPKHWNYNTLDIARFLNLGENLIASVVWNDGKYSGWAQMSFQTGFLVFSDSLNSLSIHTDTTWKAYQNTAYSPQVTPFQYVSPDEQVSGQNYPWDWETIPFNDKAWLPARATENLVISGNSPKNVSENTRKIQESGIPLPEELPQSPMVVRAFTGIKKVNPGFLASKGSLLVLPHSKIDLLLDQNILTSANIVLKVKGGLGAKITLNYSESLVDNEGKKGNRNSFKNKTSRGNSDVFILDGGERKFQPLFYRTYRYISLHIENEVEALEIKDLHGNFTAYPFAQKAHFTCNDTSVNHIWKTGWRTARLCAYETYMDCPFYEQCQYVGDTRIQALISLYVSGDERLMRNAILQLEYSIIKEGITQSRYPSREQQIIPPFSLFWIAMVHDYWMHKKDNDFIKMRLPFIIRILNWHQDHINLNGLLDNMPYWNFVDWTKEWPWVGQEIGSGTPALMKEGNSSILTLQFVWALQNTADLFRYFGWEAKGKNLEFTATQLRSQVFKKCWDDHRKFLADLPNKLEFSQHAQAMGILTGAIPKEYALNLIPRSLADTSLIQCSYYYRFYLFQALRKTNQENLYLSNLNPWKNMLNLGLTTFAETSEPSRSDCHAWSASPTYDLLAMVAGISPSSPGFASVQIKPALGTLKFCSASIPHPWGTISVLYQLVKKHWRVTILLPKKLPGTLVWGGKTYPLTSYNNQFLF